MITKQQWEAELEDLRHIRRYHVIYFKEFKKDCQVDIIRKPVRLKETSVIKLIDGSILYYFMFKNKKYLKSQFVAQITCRQITLNSEKQPVIELTTDVIDHVSDSEHIYDKCDYCKAILRTKDNYVDVENKNGEVRICKACYDKSSNL